MKKKEFNIMKNIRIIEELKAQLLCTIGDLFRILVKGSSLTQKSILECISGSIILLYLLANKLGFSFLEVDENMKKKIKLGIIEDDLAEQEDKSLSKLHNHLKERA